MLDIELRHQRFVGLEGADDRRASKVLLFMVGRCIQYRLYGLGPSDAADSAILKSLSFASLQHVNFVNFP